MSAIPSSLRAAHSGGPTPISDAGSEPAGERAGRVTKAVRWFKCKIKSLSFDLKAAPNRKDSCSVPWHMDEDECASLASTEEQGCSGSFGRNLSSLRSRSSSSRSSSFGQGSSRLPSIAEELAGRFSEGMHDGEGLGVRCGGQFDSFKVWRFEMDSDEYEDVEDEAQDVMDSPMTRRIQRRAKVVVKGEEEGGRGLCETEDCESVFHWKRNERNCTE
eukprot:CAMPEP_0171997200 /NCGR_PEP_ID=MMETSP1041-20130122/554_1 /TAXON_ID=464988 /ORGANISM="Hemiselmis andersenii, Strain CCMP439" /LENGTH=216 /DNA_ID=CAMNT_0012650447 /DNA_START=50 /DNA_END=700 /DNA_ORIENTATION=+